MKLTPSNTCVRVTDFAWLWGALGLPLFVAFACQSVLHLRRGGRPGETILVIGAAVFAGAVAVVLTQWSDFQFDAAAREVRWVRRGLFRATRGVVPFDRVRFAVVQFTPGGGPKMPRGMYRVALVTDAGTIPLTASYDGGRAHDAQCRSIRTAINELLGVPLTSEDDNDVLELDRTGNHAWAARFAGERLGLGATAAEQYLRTLQSGDVSKTAA